MASGGNWLRVRASQRATEGRFQMTMTRIVLLVMAVFMVVFALRVFGSRK